MSKKVIVFVMAAAFLMGSVAVGYAAKKIKCTVDAIDGDKVTMTCKKAGKLKVGAKVEVKVKKKAIEGC